MRVIKVRGDLRIERTALGQVVDYAVYNGDAYMGGGSKREANRVFARLLRALGDAS